MKSYRLCLYEADGEIFDADKAHLTDVIEFRLRNPQEGNVFSVLAQWEAQSKALDCAGEVQS